MASSMADESYRKWLRDEGTCSICLDFLMDPVTLECGHNFCRSCVTRSWEERPTCPKCRESVPDPRRLGTNHQLASTVQVILVSELPRQESARGAVCERHQQPLKLFCQDDQALICVVCSWSSKHRVHRVVPVEAAAQDQICQLPEFLRKEKENIFLYTTENEEESRKMLEVVQAEWEKIEAALSQRHQFLEEQKTLLQAQKEEVEKEIVRRRDDHQAILSAELSSLDSLQNLGDILERCKSKLFENPVTFPVELKSRIHDICDLNLSLKAFTERFQDEDSRVFQIQFQKASVTLDPDTARPTLILSEDCKSVREGDGCQDLPDNPKRFYYWSFVLGREGFTSGRHFWDIAVGSEEIWGVGVVRESVERKGRVDFYPQSGIWEFAKQDGMYRISSLTDLSPLSWNKELKTVRVALNYEGDQVSFFNADTKEHIYTYSGTPFRGETILPYFHVIGEAQLTILP